MHDVRKNRHDHTPAERAAALADATFPDQTGTIWAEHDRIGVGDLIRSWDFEPCEGRTDRFVEGIVTAINNDGTLSVHVVRDTAFPLGARLTIRTPVRMFICEFEGRLEVLSTYAEREAERNRRDDVEESGEREDTPATAEQIVALVNRHRTAMRNRNLGGDERIAGRVSECSYILDRLTAHKLGIRSIEESGD